VTTQENATEPSTDAGRLDDYRWLTSADATPWLESAASATQSTVQLTALLRRQLSPARTHLVLEQVELRRRAAAKFGAAAEMFFAARALEQATDQFVAAYKAARFPAGEPVADLCCGIGGDLLALAARGPATGVDRDPAIALLAAKNSTIPRAAHETPIHDPAIARGRAGEGAPAEVMVCDVATFDVGNVVAWHIDPDRRPQGRRTTQVELHEPGPDVIDRLRTLCPHAAVKLAPAAIVPDAWAEAAEQEWISRAGQCRQLICWFGSLAEHPGSRRATIVDRGWPAVRSIVGCADDEVPHAAALGQYIYEPDAAVLAAGLTATLADEHDLEAITPGVVYLTSERRIVDAALASFQVREVLPLDLRRLRDVLRAQNIGTLEIKKRGVDCEPEQLRRQLRPTGDVSATLIVLPIAGRPTVILADRLRAEEPTG
jgi:SAM-dependent methyltransferase